LLESIDLFYGDGLVFFQISTCSYFICSDMLAIKNRRIARNCRRVARNRRRIAWSAVAKRLCGPIRDFPLASRSRVVELLQRIEEWPHCNTPKRPSDDQPTSGRSYDWEPKVSPLWETAHRLL